MSLSLIFINGLFLMRNSSTSYLLKINRSQNNLLISRKGECPAEQRIISTKKSQNLLSKVFKTQSNLPILTFENTINRCKM